MVFRHQQTSTLCIFQTLSKHSQKMNDKSLKSNRKLFNQGYVISRTSLLCLTWSFNLSLFKAGFELKTHDLQFTSQILTPLTKHCPKN